MKTLDPPSTVGAVLSFDFDGTLHDPGGTPPVPRGVFEVIRRLRADHRACWGVNTGRDLEFTIEGFRESAFPFLPDWIVAREREIYFPDGQGGWMALESWNDLCTEQIRGLFDGARPVLHSVRRLVEEHTGAQWICMEGEPAGIISRTNEEMDWIVKAMAPIVADEPRLAWQRNTIYLRFGHHDFHKGSSLAEVARCHGLDASCCFAMGDSHNDLPMLDPACAAKVACPANAVDEVKERVESGGGHVADHAYGAGVIEALESSFPK